MPNVTISVPDELKAEMDKFAEVSWSEVCRKAIARYINERMNPIPNIELDIREVRLDAYHDSGYPTLSIPLRIHNKMASEIIVDRILFKIKFIDAKNNVYSVGSGADLYRRFVPANSIGEAQIFLGIMKEKVSSINDSLKKTFRCRVECNVFLQGFKNPFNTTVRTKIPIDEWERFAELTGELM